MAEGLIGEQAVVGEWDPAAGLWLVRASVPGPAGSAGLSLAGDVELDVDVATPGTLAGLSAPRGDGGAAPIDHRTRAALDTILGPSVTAALLDVRAGPPVRLSSPRLGSRRGGAGLLDPAVGRVALARLAAGGLGPFLQGLALLEASAAAATLGARAGFDGLAREDAEEGGRLVLGLAAGGDLRLDQHRSARELASALRRAATLLGGRPDLVSLAAAVDEGRFGPRRPSQAADAAMRPVPAAARAPKQEEAAAAGVAAPVAAPALRVVQPVAVDRSHLPPGVAAADVAGLRAGAAEIEVQLSGAAGRASGWWARATTADGTIVALAPVVDARGDAVARLLVPPSAVTALEIDLTAEPGTPRPSPRLRATERAVLLGQAAARATRLGLPVATSRWAACSAAWSEAGDEARAGRARDRFRPEEAGPPLVIDPLLEGVGPP